jgi:hypothetical protein
MDVTVVVPEDWLQFWSWPIFIGGAFVVIAMLCLVVVVFLKRSQNPRLRNS